LSIGFGQFSASACRQYLEPFCYLSYIPSVCDPTKRHNVQLPSSTFRCIAPQTRTAPKRGRRRGYRIETQKASALKGLPFGTCLHWGAKSISALHGGGGCTAEGRKMRLTKLFCKMLCPTCQLIPEVENHPASGFTILTSVYCPHCRFHPPPMAAFLQAVV